MEKRWIAVGIIIGIAIMGCIAAVTTQEAGRYQFPPAWTPTSSSWSVPVLDTQTGDLTCFYNGSVGTAIFIPWGGTQGQ